MTKPTNKQLCKFVKIRKNRYQKQIKNVESFDQTEHDNSRVDSFGRVVHGHPVSNCLFVQTVGDRENANKSTDDFSGIYPSFVTGDPAMIIEILDSAGLDINDPDLLNFL